LIIAYNKLFSSEMETLHFLTFSEECREVDAKEIWVLPCLGILSGF